MIEVFHNKTIADITSQAHDPVGEPSRFQTSGCCFQLFEHNLLRVWCCIHRLRWDDHLNRVLGGSAVQLDPLVRLKSVNDTVYWTRRAEYLIPIAFKAMRCFMGAKMRGTRNLTHRVEIHRRQGNSAERTTKLNKFSAFIKEEFAKLISSSSLVVTFAYRPFGHGLPLTKLCAVEHCGYSVTACREMPCIPIHPTPPSRRGTLK